jgi:hypothetical protein
MACTALASGRSLACKENVGGIKAIYFATFGSLGDLTVDTDDSTVTAFGGTPTWYQWDVKGANSLEQTITASRDNGTVFYDQIVTAVFTKLDADTQEELLKIIGGRPHIVVEDYNGNKLLVGAYNGVDVNGGSIGTGAAMGDLSGYSLTLQGMEKLPAFFVTATVTGDSTQITP